ncbi:MAG: hypothetical protein JNK18_13700 [Cyclobacteriaceae bacterium]|nr:hypothetical protein [Cyclobacteriaceae bacterium]
MDENNTEREIQDQLANWAGRIRDIAMDICAQALGQRVTLKEKYILGMLQRQAGVLRSVQTNLATESHVNQTATFILLRCLLDDFITLLYYQSREWQESDIIKHTATAYDKRLKMVKNSKDINVKYFEGTAPGLPTEEYYKQELQDFYDNPANDIYFKNVARREWKSFIATTNIITQLPINGISRANAHSLTLWQLYSTYVHYSSVTQQLENSNTGSRKIELLQLQEALSYVYKTLMLASHVLGRYGIRHEFRDTTDVYAEIFEGYNDEVNPDAE